MSHRSRPLEKPLSLLGWIFGRKRAPLADEVGQWRVVEVTSDAGVRVVARTRVQRPDLPNLLAFTTAVSVCWSYDSADGFPDPKTGSAMESFEASMDDLSGSDFSYLIQVRTGFEERTWLYYTADLERFLTELQARARSAGGPPIRAEAADDPDWSQWNDLVQELSRAPSS